MSEEANRLANEHGGIWGEHPDYPVVDWEHEASNDYTRASYWDWVLGKLDES